MKYIWQRPDWPNFSFKINMLAELLGKTRFRQGQLISRIQSLGFDLNQEARAEILIEETIKTSAVEGAKLDSAQVRSSVARHLDLPNAGITTSERYIDGLVEVLLDATNCYNEPLTLERIKGWQAALFPTGYSGIHHIAVGQWRDKPMQVISGPIGRERVHYEAPPHSHLGKEMRQFLAWWTKGIGKIDGLIRAGLAHFYFVTIHPFEDGNGRIARALTDMALAQDEKLPQRFYSFSSQIMAERKTYYDILESSQNGSLDVTDWLTWFLSCTKRAIERSEKIVAHVMSKAKFWQRHANTPISGRQRKAINTMLDAGQGNFEGGLTTRKYVSLAKVSRATAYREITDLVEKGYLRQNKGHGRNISYDIVWE